MIDAETMMNNDSIDMEELAKHEVQYEEKDLQNEEKVAKIIQRYKNRINDLYFLPLSQTQSHPAPKKTQRWAKIVVEGSEPAAERGAWENQPSIATPIEETK